MATEYTNQKPKLIVVLGPTATGKSDFAVEIAHALKDNKRFEIISADSRQIYRGLNIGSGKITKAEMRNIPHYGLDIVSPKRKKMFSVAEFQAYANKKALEIIKRGNIPILCGGTGFYIQSIAEGIIFPEIDANPELRKKLGAYSKEKLQQMLEKLDPERYKEIDQQNPARLIRAIEIAKALGKVPKIKADPKFDILQIGLDSKDEVLKNKIHKRILVRMKKGMIREAKTLHANGVSWKRMKQFGLEYGLLADLLQNKMTREQFIERLSFDIWHYVKRQRAWFKRDSRILWIDPSKKSDARLALKKVKEFLKV